MKKISSSRNFGSKNVVELAPVLEENESTYSSDSEISDIIDLYTNTSYTTKSCDSFVSIFLPESPPKSPISQVSSPNLLATPNPPALGMIDRYNDLKRQINFLLSADIPLCLAEFCQNAANLFCLSSQVYASRHDKTSNYSKNIHFFSNQKDKKTVRLHQLYVKSLKDAFSNKFNVKKKSHHLAYLTHQNIQNILPTLLDIESSKRDQKHAYQALSQSTLKPVEILEIAQKERSALCALYESISQFLNDFETEIQSAKNFQHHVSSLLEQMNATKKKYDKDRTIQSTDGLISPIYVPSLLAEPAYTIRTYKELKAIDAALRFFLNKTAAYMRSKRKHLQQPLLQTYQALGLLLTHQMSLDDFQRLVAGVKKPTQTSYPAF